MPARAAVWSTTTGVITATASMCRACRDDRGIAMVDERILRDELLPFGDILDAGFEQTPEMTEACAAYQAPQSALNPRAPKNPSHWDSKPRPKLRLIKGS